MKRESDLTSLQRYDMMFRKETFKSSNPDRAVILRRCGVSPRGSEVVENSVRVKKLPYQGEFIFIY